MLAVHDRSGLACEPREMGACILGLVCENIVVAMQLFSDARA